MDDSSLVLALNARRRSISIQRGLHQLLRSLHQIHKSQCQHTIWVMKLFSCCVGSGAGAVEDFASGGEGFFGADGFADVEQSAWEVLLRGAGGAWSDAIAV